MSYHLSFGSVVVVDFLQLAAEHEQNVIEWRRHLHRNPELSGREKETAKFVSNVLKSFGVDEVDIVGETGVAALIRGGCAGKTLALRADMDALPGEEKTGLPFSSKNPEAAHLCGHDAHTAILLGVAQILHSLKEKFSGNVRLVFQPAEENLTGAKLMIRGGVLDSPEVDCIAGLHLWPALPAGTVGLRYGASMAAADSVKIEFRGSQGHAAHPHECVDPLLMAGQFLVNVQAIVSREIAPADSAVLSFGKISGGTVGNIIPDKVLLEGSIRTLLPETRERMAAALERFASSAAQGMRGEASVTISRGVPPLASSTELLALFENSAKELLGADRVVHLVAPSMGSEDFAYYLERVPGFFFRIGVARQGELMRPLHSAAFDPDESSFKTGVAVLCRFAMDFLARE